MNIAVPWVMHTRLFQSQSTDLWISEYRTKHILNKTEYQNIFINISRRTITYKMFENFPIECMNISEYWWKCFVILFCLIPICFVRYSLIHDSVLWLWDNLACKTQESTSHLICTIFSICNPLCILLFTLSNWRRDRFWVLNRYPYKNCRA